MESIAETKTVILSNPPSFTVSAPFDAPADVILRSVDNHEFHVFKIILSIASPFFRDMFSLGQSSIDGSKPDTPPIIDVTERAITLDHILRFLYPVVHPTMNDLATIEDVLSVAEKYDISIVIEDMKRPLRKLRKGQPLRVFAIACRFNLEDTARDAAMFFRDHISRSKNVTTTQYSTPWNMNPAGESYVAEMAHISAGSYLRLVNYVRTGVISTFCQPSCPASQNLPIVPTIDPRLSSAEPDIIVRSSDDVDFQANRLILTLVSEVFEKEINHLTSSQSSDTILEDQHLPVLQVNESATTLSVLLRLCYPTNRPSLESVELDVITAVFDASVKYEITSVAEECRASLLTPKGRDPLRLFLTAVHLGSNAAARNAAIQMTPMVLEDKIIPELERTNANVLHALFKFQHEYRRAICNISSYGDKEDIYSKINDAQWIWLEDNNDIHPELIYAAIAEATIQKNYYRGDNWITMNNRLPEMVNLKVRSRLILDQVQLDLSWLLTPKLYKKHLNKKKDPK
ncbi:hypothetical protein C8Q75DRAFT_740767 [Abortiporus biennis]|nr:hypothetical protein C8Q75DRAFT_740767 [Abortiporus biennis]